MKVSFFSLSGVMGNYLRTNSWEQKERFLNLKSPEELADLLEVEHKVLVYYLYNLADEDKYFTFSIPKKSGGFREIRSPHPILKELQQKLNEILLNVYVPETPVFSYLKERNIVQNARLHQNQKWVFNLDLKDFFPTIHFGRVRGLFMSEPYSLPDNVSTLLAQLCCFDNQLPQGAPTSPMISNMICARMDRQLLRFAREHHCLYSRYADDITISCPAEAFPEQVVVKNTLGIHVGKELTEIIAGNGFSINEQKLRMQPWVSKQEVTGLTVNLFPNVSRKYVRQIRAMLYAWQKFGLENAERDFIQKHDDKFRHPDANPPSFKRVLKGKIDFLGLVRGKHNTLYRRFKKKYIWLQNQEKNS